MADLESIMLNEWFASANRSKSKPPRGLREVFHLASSNKKLAPNLVRLHLDPAQTGKYSVIGSPALAERIRSMRPCGVDIMHDLLDAPEKLDAIMIAHWDEDCYGLLQHLAFWGTLYADSARDLYVPCIVKEGEVFRRRHFRLDGIWDSAFPALIHAPS